MKRFCLIGHPLGHSMSPFIHGELFRLNNIDASYELRDIPPERLGGEFEELRRYDGFNVTIPHKLGIIPMLDSLSDRAELFGAVNTVEFRGAEAVGNNTDCIGFLRSLDMAGMNLIGRVLVCGAGGVSRMFAFESAMAGAQVTLAVRQNGLEKAERIKLEMGEKLGAECKIITLDEVCGGYDLLINGTPVGMYPDSGGSVVPESVVADCGAVFDAVYNPLDTTLVKYAKRHGIRQTNGLPMLVWQAAVAQEIWLGASFTNAQISSVISAAEKEMNRR